MLPYTLFCLLVALNYKLVIMEFRSVWPNYVAKFWPGSSCLVDDHASYICGLNVYRYHFIISPLILDKNMYICIIAWRGGSHTLICYSTKFFELI